MNYSPFEDPPEYHESIATGQTNDNPPTEHRCAMDKYHETNLPTRLKSAVMGELASKKASPTAPCSGSLSLSTLQRAYAALETRITKMVWQLENDRVKEGDINLWKDIIEGDRKAFDEIETVLYS